MSKQEPAIVQTLPLSLLTPGTKIVLTDPDGVGKVTKTRKATWIKTAEGHCVEVEWEVISGPSKGETGSYLGGKSDTVEIINT